MSLRLVFSSSALPTLLKLREAEGIKLLYHSINVDPLILKSESVTGNYEKGNLHKIAIVSKNPYG